MQKIVNSLAEKLLKSKKTVIFTGAGMSTESGLPDFRSPSGLWGKYRPEELASIEALNRNFENFAAFYRSRMDTLDEVRPNKGHMILAEWEKRGLVSAIVTQNVDGLHQAAGSENIYELHGTLRDLRCQRCQAVYPAQNYSQDSLCEKCGGKLRPAVVLFGEMLPEDTLSDAFDLAASSDVFIVLGSSLTVSPANLLPERAKRNGAALFIVNRTPTPLDSLADGLLSASIGEVLSAVDEKLQEGESSS